MGFCKWVKRLLHGCFLSCYGCYLGYILFLSVSLLNDYIHSDTKSILQNGGTSVCSSGALGIKIVIIFSVAMPLFFIFGTPVAYFVGRFFVNPVEPEVLLVTIEYSDEEEYEEEDNEDTERDEDDIEKGEEKDEQDVEKGTQALKPMTMSRQRKDMAMMARRRRRERRFRRENERRERRKSIKMVSEGLVYFVYLAIAWLIIGYGSTSLYHNDSKGHMHIVCGEFKSTAFYTDAYSSMIHYIIAYVIATSIWMYHALWIDSFYIVKYAGNEMYNELYLTCFEFCLSVNYFICTRFNLWDIAEEDVHFVTLSSLVKSLAFCLTIVFVVLMVGYLIFVIIAIAVIYNSIHLLALYVLTPDESDCAFEKPVERIYYYALAVGLHSFFGFMAVIFIGVSLKGRRREAESTNLRTKLAIAEGSLYMGYLITGWIIITVGYYVVHDHKHICDDFKSSDIFQLCKNSVHAYMFYYGGVTCLYMYEIFYKDEFGLFKKRRYGSFLTTEAQSIRNHTLPTESQHYGETRV